MDFSPSSQSSYLPHFGKYRRTYDPSSGLSTGLDYRMNAYYGTQALRDSYIDGRDIPFPAPLEALTDPFTTQNRTDPLDQFLTGKRASVTHGVADILGLIYEREHLKYQNLSRIDYDACQTKSRLFEIYYCPTGINPHVDKLRTNIERELIGFEREKRMEEIACWRDTCRLRTDLRELMRQFSQEQQKRYLLTGADDPWTSNNSAGN